MHVDKNRNDFLCIFVACSFSFLLTKEQEQQKTRHCLMTHKKENMQRQNLYLKVPEMSANKVGIVANLNLHNLPHRSAFFFNSSRLVETQRESANAEEKSVSLSLCLSSCKHFLVDSVDESRCNSIVNDQLQHQPELQDSATGILLSKICTQRSKWEARS